jgi:hypothetical protein
MMSCVWSTPPPPATSPYPPSPPHPGRYLAAFPKAAALHPFEAALLDLTVGRATYLGVLEKARASVAGSACVSVSACFPRNTVVCLGVPVLRVLRGCVSIALVGVFGRVRVSWCVRGCALLGLAVGRATYLGVLDTARGPRMGVGQAGFRLGRPVRGVRVHVVACVCLCARACACVRTLVSRAPSPPPLGPWRGRGAMPSHARRDARLKPPPAPLTHTRASYPPGGRPTQGPAGGAGAEPS